MKQQFVQNSNAAYTLPSGFSPPRWVVPGPDLKVAHVVTRLTRGGAAADIISCALGLQKRGFDCTVITGAAHYPEVSVEETVRSLGLTLIVIPELTCAAGSPVNDIVALYKLWRLIRQGDYTIVHTHTSKAGLLGRLAAKLAGVPIVIHRTHGHVFYGFPYGRFRTRLFIALERFAAAFTDRIVTLTQREIWEHVQAKIAPAHKFAAIPSGVDLDCFTAHCGDAAALRASLDIPANVRVITCIGRLTYHKGHSVLIDASALMLRELPASTFLLVGDGELAGTLKRSVIERGLAKDVRFLGWRDDVPDLLGITDLVVLASHNEGMGRVLVEAMAAGKPIIATRTGGIPDVVLDGKTGILVPPGDPIRLAEAMKTLLVDRDLALQMAEEGRARAREFGTAGMVDRVYELYVELLREKALDVSPVRPTFV